MCLECIEPSDDYGIEMDWGCIKDLSYDELEVEPEWNKNCSDVYECNSCEKGPCAQL